MWEDILKRGSGKKLDYSFLKQTTLSLANKFKGKTLVKDEFLDFLEQVRKDYSVKHKSITLGRIRNAIIRILKTNNLLEIKKKRLGPEEFRRQERIYIFME